MPLPKLFRLLLTVLALRQTASRFGMKRDVALTTFELKLLHESLNAANKHVTAAPSL